MSEGEERRFYGKFRGVVLNNVDPLQKGRLLVQVGDVDGLTPTTWAMPCFPFTGRQMGMWALPQIGAGVWVEFEQGDPDYPIWVGGWYASASEPPALALTAVPATPNIVLQTQGQTTLMLSDTPGPTGGIFAENRDRCAYFDQRCRHHVEQWQRRHDHPDRPHSDGQQRRPCGNLKRRKPCPDLYITLAPPPCARMAGR
jgi:uncharacterized protein involved in type VI secretion and phage assembly